MSNKARGNTFESELCQRLADFGFWAHNFAQRPEGQPADVIAVRNKTAHLIDAKVCSRNTFTIGRIESNQMTSMQLWRECGNGQGWFALKMGGEVYMLSVDAVEVLSKKSKTIQLRDAEVYGSSLKEWVRGVA